MSKALTRRTLSLSGARFSGGGKSTYILTFSLRLRRYLSGLLMVLVGVHPAYALDLNALPNGGSVAVGSASMVQSDSRLDINQTTQHASINWDTFNIGANAQVNFHQPSASSVALNRVAASAGASEIFGQLNANGQVFLLNPNGVFFSQNAQVNVGSLVASTMSLSDADFLAGKYTFLRNGSSAAVINQGTLTAAGGGYIALLAPEVRNEGTITARLGTVALGSGEQITLDFFGDRLVNLAVDQSALRALVENRHLIQADGGTVILAARAEGDLAATVVNNAGMIRAQSIASVNGTIRLGGGNEGIVSVSGTLDASGQDAGQTGGSIQVLGDQVGLFAGANLDASGDAGGGTVLVGGDFQGKNPNVQNAFRTYVGEGVSINANAVTNGNGGRVIVWADDVTRDYGSISVRGGAQSGDGGFVEVSGKESLVFRGMVDASAPHGLAGRVLFDPKNIIIANGGASAVATNDQFAENSGADATFDADLITAITSGGTAVTLQANNDITVNEAINTGNTAGNDGILTLQAGRSILINNSITTDNGAFVAVANATVANGVVDASRNAGAAAITMANGVTINTGVANITLTMSTGPTTNNTSGDITISNLTTTGNVLITQGGQTVGSDVLRTATSLITAASVALDISNASNTTGVIGATGAGNVINTTVANLEARTQGDSIFINETNALVIGWAALGGLVGINSGTGNITLTAGGAVTQTEAITVGGTSSFSAGANAITLSNAGNNFTGAVSLNNSGVNNVAVRDANAIVLGASSVGSGTLAVTAAGAITQAGPIIQAAGAGGVSLTAGAANNITLSDAGNDFAGAVRIVSGNNVTLNDANAFAFGNGGTSAVSGSLSLTTGGAVTQANALTVVGTSSITAGANAITLSNAGNNFTGAVS
ncbi:MAG: filamentous hemagglutinin N-terminal domain-containing protein, partial [Pseudomonadota bacterium]